MSADEKTVYLSLGSNLGDREANLKRAIELLSHKVRLGLVSSIYETEPVGNIGQPKFLNLACQVFTRLAAKDLDIRQRCLAYFRTIQRHQDFSWHLTPF